MLNHKPLRKIKSFVRRDGRLTDGQQQAIAHHWARFGIDVGVLSKNAPEFSPDRFAQPIPGAIQKSVIEQGVGFLDFNAIFNKEAPLALEIGFGSGQSLLEVASLNPEIHFIGIETHLPGIGALLQHIEARSLDNIRVLYADAVEVLQNAIQDQTFSVVQIFFPDPWPKRKHHKRRLIQPEFVQLLVEKMKIGAMLHIATDWEDYAKHILNVLKNASQLENKFTDFAPRSDQRPLVTKFEQRGLKEGRFIWEFQFIRKK